MYSYIARDFHSRFDPPLFISFFFVFQKDFSPYNWKCFQGASPPRPPEILPKFTKTFLGGFATQTPQNTPYICELFHEIWYNVKIIPHFNRNTRQNVGWDLVKLIRYKKVLFKGGVVNMPFLKNQKNSSKKRGLMKGGY